MLITAEVLDNLERRYSSADPAVVQLVREYRELAPRAACPCFDAIAEQRLRGQADNAGAGDRWEDPRDTMGGAP